MNSSQEAPHNPLAGIRRPSYAFSPSLVTIIGIDVCAWALFWTPGFTDRLQGIDWRSQATCNINAVMQGFRALCRIASATFRFE